MAQEQRSINELLQTIPQEIYDRIYEETFTADHQKIHITQSYTPPKLMSIDRASRKKFAQSFYANTTFVLRGFPLRLNSWYPSIDPAHRSMLGAVECHSRGSQPRKRENWEAFRVFVAEKLRRQHGEELVKVFRIVVKDQRFGDIGFLGQLGMTGSLS